MLPFLKKKTLPAPAPEETVEPAQAPTAPVAPFNQIPERRKPATTPGVQMLKDVWHIGTQKKKKDMAPPGVSSDIYNVPKQRQMPPRNTGGR